MAPSLELPVDEKERLVILPVVAIIKRGRFHA